MSIMEELEDLKKKLEEDQKEEQPAEEQPEVVEEPIAEPVSDEAPEEEPSQEPVKEKPVDPPAEEKPDNAAMARMRRELAAAQRRAKELEESLKKPAPVQEPVQVAPEPDPEEDPAAWAKWYKEKTDSELNEFRSWKQQQESATRQSHAIQSAVQELNTLESNFRSTAPDYDAVSQHMIDQIKNNIKGLAPHKSEQEVTADVQRYVLARASEYAKQGLNPIEEMYYLAKESYTPVEKPAPKPDMGKIAANRARNAGMAGATGSSGRPAVISLEAAAQLSPAEWAALPEDQKERIMRGVA